MPHYVAMIPARLGSKRIKKKNLRMLGDKPLIAHVIDTACKSGEFDQVYVNSEAVELEAVAQQYGARFYRRLPELASDDATNDQFALDFMNAVPCDVLMQINPTSPFTGVEDLRRARKMFEEGYDTVLAVREMRVEAVHKGEPVNWNPLGQMPPSQLLEPVYVFSNGILAWRTSVFRRNMEQRGCAVYGGDGRTGYCIVRGDATLDIDNEEDFMTAEAVLQRIHRASAPVRYWEPDAKAAGHCETDVGSILQKDGVDEVDLEDANQEIINITKLLESLPKNRSSSKRVINSLSNSATVISQMPGEGNRRHYHSDWDEWWLILEGQWDWEIEGQIRRVRTGDLIFIPRHRWHKVTAAGDCRAIRLAVSRDKVAHIYSD